MPKFNLGSTRGNNIKPRAARSDTIPPEVLPETDPTLSNLESLVDIQFKPLFSELYERGRGDYGAFASDFLGVELHSGQLKWAHTFPFANERHLTTGNRFGKSVIASIILLHDAFYQTRDPNYAELTNEYIAINLSLTIDMAKIVTDYILRFSLDSKMFRRFVIENEIKTAPFPLIPIGTSKNQRVNAFRSEIWARSSSKDARYLLGRKFDLVNYDECARDPHGDKILDEVLRMRLADRNGRLHMTSTAAGRNWFFLAYRRGMEDADHLQYYSQTGSSYDNPHINHDRVAQNEAVMSEMWKLQNIYGGFSDYANVFFRPQVEAMYEGVEYPICTDFKKLANLNVPTDAKYVIGIDWALKRDETVIIVARVDEDAKKLEDNNHFNRGFPIVYIQGFGFKETGGRWSWDELKNIMVLVHKRFNNGRILVDSTGVAGEALLQDLTMLGSSNHEGYDFAGGNGQQKDNLIYVAQQALQNRIFKFPFNPVTATLVDQLLMYDRDDKLLKTDYVFAFCLLAENLRRANLPASELLSQPLLFGIGNRVLGRGTHPFDKNYEMNIPGLTRRPNPLTTPSGLILTSTGYKELNA